MLRPTDSQRAIVSVSLSRLDRVIAVIVQSRDGGRGERITRNEIEIQGVVEKVRRCPSAPMSVRELTYEYPQVKATIDITILNIIPISTENPSSPTQ